MRTLEALRKLDKDTKAEVYLVGGFVRDLLRKKRNDDLDIVIRKLSMKNITGYLEKLGHVKRVNISQTNDNIRTSILLFKSFKDDTEAQISLPRRGKRQIANMNNTLSQDSLHRDFTINSMYLRVDNIVVKNVVDPLEGYGVKLSGKDDISNRVIKAVWDADNVIKSSPVRMMRALSLSARTGYSIDPNLTEAIKNNVDLLDNVPVEIVRREFDRLIMSKKPSKYIRLMRKLGILAKIVPELDACYGVTQDKKYHKYDVFTHCIYSCDNSDGDLVLRLAALFHDLGKATTRRVIDKRITFHKHEMASARMADDIMKRLRYDNETRKKVVNLVRLHMYHYTREYTDAAVRRFIRKTAMTQHDIDNIESFPLFKLRSAERLGNGNKHIPVTEKQLDFQKRIKVVYKQSNAVSLADLDISGKDLLEMFKIRPGKIVGEVLNHLMELVIEKPSLNKRCKLLTQAAEYLCNK